jgi:hypothetical protein
MKRLNEKVLKESFDMKPDSIYEITIRLSKEEKNCLTSLIKHYYHEEEKHFYESGENGDHIYLYWLKFLDELPEDYRGRIKEWVEFIP